MLPPDLDTVTVYLGPYLTPAGVPVGGTVTFTPEWPLVHGPSGTTILAAPVPAILDDAGTASVVLPASDAAGLLRTNVRYRVAAKFDNGVPALSTFLVLLPASSPEVDLDVATPVTGPDGSVVTLPAGLAADGAASITLRSPADQFADTTRLRVVSYQKQELENGRQGGEGVWLDLADPRAKNMLTWRLAMDKVTRTVRPVGPIPVPPPEADMQRIVWAGAHYFAQDQVDYANPTDVHGHWSVEVPDTNLDLRTRFEIRYVGQDGKIGLDRTLIQTENADLTVDTSLGCRLRLRSGPGSDRLMEVANDEWGLHPRWRWGAPGNQAETGASAGSNFGIGNYNDADSLIGWPLVIKRSNGQVFFGGTATIPGQVDGAQEGVQVNRNHAGTAFAVNSNLTGGAGVVGYAFTALDVASRALSTLVGADVTARHVTFADGKHEWGPGGSSSRDVNLYRDRADVLKTDDALKVGAYATTGRPSASAVGAGAHIFDSTLNRPIWSTGSAWVDAMGTAV